MKQKIIIIMGKCKNKYYCTDKFTRPVFSLIFASFDSRWPYEFTLYDAANVTIRDDWFYSNFGKFFGRLSIII